MNVLNKYNQLNNRHCVENIKFLIENKVNFSIFCELSKVSFTPALPEEIFSKFGPFVLFVLAGYSFSSLVVTASSVEFEAGFGRDNIGSFVNVKIDGIIQLIVKDKKDDNVVLFSRNEVNEIFSEKEDKKDSLESSAAAIFSDPQNQKILKKIQKIKPGGK
ncbi:hypothetical protein [Helicobacter cappadocius]|uniref:Uncharacterized protein n=1 Tax=Helicobacter cappadocius TaxID=3063998 RepID=A0AA90PQH6_9HELI|nr:MULTISPECIES: hypothetical protein [unclassified Helicobacter]MDO7252858.1 hypothetical protein [Helicobacter sp. faydin-H75]MDP2538901.1 hypothetical protein [Helicobacter sp. faydin-H76]